MLTPYFPEWLMSPLSLLFNVLAPKLPSAIKGTVLLAVCIAVMAGVAAATDLPGSEAAAQGFVLFTLISAGYTVMKPVAEIKNAAALGAIALGLCVLGAASTVVAQEATSPVVAQTALTWQTVVFALVNGLLGRLFKRGK